MDEGDAPTAGPGPRNFVDQSVSRLATSRQRRLEIGNPVADVVNPRTPPFEEPGNGAIGAERREQLDLGIPEGERDDRRPIGLLRGMRAEAEDIPVEGERGVEVVHGDAYMSDAGVIRQAIPPSNLVETESTTGE
jgi:hypothetical protein